jgi:hypothetical protein
MGHILPLVPSHFQTLNASFSATNGQLARYDFMATQVHTVPEALTARPHQVALPYRGDGVALALHDAFDPTDDGVPRDMAVLISAIDRLSVAAERFDLIHDRIKR